MLRHILATAAIIVVPLALFGCSDDNDDAVSDEVQEVLDAYSSAFEDYDGAAFLAVVTDDFTFRSELDEFDATEQSAAIGDLESSGWVAKQTGDAVMAGDGPWYVAYPNTIDDDMMSPLEGLTILTIVDDEGTLKVAEQTFVYDF